MKKAFVYTFDELMSLIARDIGAKNSELRDKFLNARMTFDRESQTATYIINAVADSKEELDKLRKSGKL